MALPTEVIFRPFRGPDDFPGLAELITRAWRDAGMEAVQTADRLRDAWENPTGWHPRSDAIVVESGASIIGYGRVEASDAVDGTRNFYSIGWIDPDHLRRGIGSALLAANLERIRRNAGIARDGDTVQMFAMSRQPGAAALAVANGFEPVGYDAWMVRPDLENLPDLTVPEGITVRPPEPHELRAVWEADVEGFRDHFGATEQDEDDWNHWLATETTDPSLWQVAWDGDRVVSQVRVYIDEDENRAFGRRRGWTEDISTVPEYRRRGLARSLLVLGLHALRDRGMAEAALNVHTEGLHGAKRLYESVGFRVDQVTTTYRKPLTLT